MLLLQRLLSKAFCRVWMLLPTRARVLAYRCLIYVGRRLYGPNLHTFPLPFNLYAKYSGDSLELEARALRFVAEKTTIPVPHVIDCVEITTGGNPLQGTTSTWTPPRRFLLVMTRLPGEPLRDRINDMTDAERVRFAQDLGASLRQLHSLTAPDSRVAGVDGGPFKDWRIVLYRKVGPFDSEKEFYEYLYHRVPLEDRPRLREIAHEVHDTPHPLCLTHNDLSHTNVLVHDNRFSGLVDWECAAWLPEWWEYTRSLYVCSDYTEWIDIMNIAHPQTYPKELKVEEQFWNVNYPFSLTF